MFKYIIFYLMVKTVFCTSSTFCTNECLPIDIAKQQVANYCNSTSVCFAPYTVYNDKVLYGLTPHMGVFLSNNGIVTSYGLTKKGWFNTPDILLEGGQTKSGNNISFGNNINVIGVKRIFSNDIKVFKIKNKLKYSAIEWEGDNCASIIVKISRALGYNMICKFKIAQYYFGPSIPELCKFS
jgi:hypothetical protein